MERHEAAEVLGLATNATRAQVARAYRRLARESHPDLQSGAAVRDQVRAQEQFITLTRARDVLILDEPRGSIATPNARRSMKHNWPLLGTWVALMLVAVTVSVAGSSLPLTIWEPVLRFAIMVASAIGFALTGSRAWLVAMCVSIAATALTTILFTTFGSLLGMLLLAAPLYGLFVAGRGRSGFREKGFRSHDLDREHVRSEA